MAIHRLTDVEGADNSLTQMGITTDDMNTEMAMAVMGLIAAILLAYTKAVTALTGIAY